LFIGSAPSGVENGQAGGLLALERQHLASNVSIGRKGRGLEGAETFPAVSYASEDAGAA
jgi:hypothetical protein